jgi:ribosomal protein S18 acetylase RimI-like enzyme
MELRKLRPEELQNFLDLMEISFKDSFEEDRVDMSEVRSIMKKMTRPHYKFIARIMGVKSEFYIIEHDNVIASGITLGFEKNEASVGNIMTHPAYRKQGLARQLLRFSAERAKSLGFKQLNLSVRAENTPAVGLYTSEGFERNYHSGKFRIYLLNHDLPLDESSNIKIQLIDRIDYQNMDKMLDDCFPSFYFESRNRTRWIKSYIPSRILRFVARKMAGQTINTYGFFLNDEEIPRGYIQTSQSKIDEQISITSPILLEDDNGILLEVIPQILQRESNSDSPSLCTLSISMHRDDAIKRIEQIGFTRVRESLSMAKTL